MSKVEKRPDPHDPKTWEANRPPASTARHVEGWLSELAEFTSMLKPTYHLTGALTPPGALTLPTEGAKS